MGTTIEEVTKPMILGEGPHWDAEKQCLYFVNIMGKTIHKYDPATGVETKTSLTRNVHFIVPLSGASDQFVVGLGHDAVIIKWDGKDNSDAEEIKTIASVDTEPGLEENGLNDGKADPTGRLYSGTIGKMKQVDGKFTMDDNMFGALYSFSKNGAQKWDNDVKLSNGLSWDLKRKSMYYVDTLVNKIYGYDHDSVTGSATNRRIVLDYKKTGLAGMLDGMTIDTDGNLWAAVFQGSKVIKVDPVTGEILQTVPIPVEQVTSVTFGGKNLDELYVTTGSMKLETEPKPPAGAIFRVKGLNVKGYAGVSCIL